ncbi:MAG: hypothetical protein IKN51_06575, partial [Bacteroidaceae bacterium]|nr:hypothetical protein [Bacteroidaceae bacterium]
MPGGFPDEKGGNLFPSLEWKECRRRHKYGKGNRERRIYNREEITENREKIIIANNREAQLLAPPEIV